VFRNGHPVARHHEQLESNVRILRQSGETHALACAVSVLVIFCCLWQGRSSNSHRSQTRSTTDYRREQLDNFTSPPQQFADGFVNFLLGRNTAAPLCVAAPVSLATSWVG
jgi:hypothetical protein